MLFRLKGIEETDNVWMVALFEDAHLELGSSSLINLISQSLLAHRLDRNELLTQLVHG